MSVAIAEAFGGRAWLFVAAYLLLQVGRAVFLIVALRGRALGEHFVNVLVWELIAGGLWVAGAFAEGTARLALWGFAVVVAYGGAGILHWLPGRGQRVGLGQTDIAGEHLFERFRLFFLIVLGESVLTAGNAFTDERFEVERLLALAIGFTGTVALWWCYFQRTEAIGIEVAENAADAGGVGQWATWTLMLMVLALIGIAVGDELAIAHPGDEEAVALEAADDDDAIFLTVRETLVHQHGAELRVPLFHVPYLCAGSRSSQGDSPEAPAVRSGAFGDELHALGLAQSEPGGRLPPQRRRRCRFRPVGRTASCLRWAASRLPGGRGFAIFLVLSRSSKWRGSVAVSWHPDSA
jgi:Bacterial low temperature requirement A protein (LtrA)